jgi:hypothetical protein
VDWAGLVARTRVALAWVWAWAPAAAASAIRAFAGRQRGGRRLGGYRLSGHRLGGYRLGGYRLGPRGAWVVAISGLSGLAVGAVSSTVYASVPLGSSSAAQAADAPATPSADATIPPIVATGGEVATTIETVEVPLEPQSIQQTDKYLPAGYQEVVSKGDPGLQLAMYAVTTVNGVETGRELLAGFVVKEPTHDVVSVGSLQVSSRGAVVPGSNRDIGQRLAASWGWTGVEWLCLDNLFERESNWRTTADNPSSSAYGIPQALPGSKMASAGADWLTNPATQITWGLGYIKGRYGTPCGAWGKFSERSPHWY